MKDNYILDLAIEDEIMGISYYKSSYDKPIIKQLMEDINIHKNTNYRYLAQLDILKIDDINDIIIKYIDEFQSSHIKVILLKQLVLGQYDKKEDLAINLYNDFKKSKYYISDIGESSCHHIYNIYDNILSNFNYKKDKIKLLCVIKNPRDAFYLPLTLKMMAQLKIDEMKEILIKFLDSAFITRKVGSQFNDELYDPNLSQIKRTLKLYALEYLKYYPTEDVHNIVIKYESNKDLEIQKIARKTLNHIKK